MQLFAVYANHKGGMKAAMIIPFISGVIQVIGGGLAAYIFQLSQFGGWQWQLRLGYFMVGLRSHHEIRRLCRCRCTCYRDAVDTADSILQNKKHYFMIAEDYEQYKEEIEAENKVEFSTEAA